MHGDLIAAADAMRSLLQERVEELAGCIEGSPEEASLACLAGSTPTTKLAMRWQQTPRDDAWKRVTLASVAGLGQQIWLRCNGCGHEQHFDPLAFAAFHDLDAATPLLTIGQRLKCTACGEQKAHCWPHAAYRPGGGE